MRAVSQNLAIDAGARGIQPRSSIGIRYLGVAPLRVRGPVTGRQYEFSGSHPVRPVDIRDTGSLLRTRLFRPT
jgi:hypothetical protein